MNRTSRTILGHFAWLALALTGLCWSCSGDSAKSESEGEFVPSVRPKEEKDGILAGARGGGKFVYSKYRPLEDKPVNVHYYIPKNGDVTRMPLLFAMHGAERTSTAQLTSWTNLAETYRFILIAPEFTKENGYTENDYQFGGIFVSASSDRTRPEEQWTYQLIEALFDYIKVETDNTSEFYNMFGHSAGGQFVHRFLWAMPHARVNRAVAANPGSLTFPLIDGITGTDQAVYGWPYSIYKSPFADKEHLRSFFARQLFIQTGTEDTRTDNSFPDDPPSMAQGKTRHERAHTFYTCCQEQAKALGISLTVKIVDVKGAGHSSQQMVYGLPSPDLTKPEKRGEGNAYDLLFN